MINFINQNACQEYCKTFNILIVDSSRLFRDGLSLALDHIKIDLKKEYS
jgi:hypothetical protein